MFEESGTGIVACAPAILAEDFITEHSRAAGEGRRLLALMGAGGATVALQDVLSRLPMNDTLDYFVHTCWVGINRPGATRSVISLEEQVTAD